MVRRPGQKDQYKIERLLVTTWLFRGFGNHMEQKQFLAEIQTLKFARVWGHDNLLSSANENQMVSSPECLNCRADRWLFNGVDK